MLTVLALATIRDWRGGSSAAPARDRRYIDPATSCGPVALAVISRVLDRPGTIAAFHELTGSGELGVCSLADLERAIEHHGLAATAVRHNPQRPPRHRLPMVLYVDGRHFLAALPAGADRVIVLDPPSEPRVRLWAELRTRWRGEALVIGATEADVRRASNGG